MKTLRLLSGGLTSLMLLALLAAAGAWLLRSSITRRAHNEAKSQEKAIATTTASRGDFDVAVVSSGELSAVKSMPSLAEVTGQVVRVIPSGTMVKEGDIIVELDTPRMERRVRSQQRQYQQSVEDLDTKKRDYDVNIEKARLKVEQSKRELNRYQAQQDAKLADLRDQKKKDEDDLALSRQRYERQKKLAAGGLVPGREVELAETQLKAQQFNIERETKELELQEASTASELINKQTAVREAEADLETTISKRRDELGDTPENAPPTQLSADSGEQTPARGEQASSTRGRGRERGEGRQAGASSERRQGRRQQAGNGASGASSSSRTSSTGGAGQMTGTRGGQRRNATGTTTAESRSGGRGAGSVGSTRNGSMTMPSAGMRGGGAGLPPAGSWGQAGSAGTAVLELQMRKAQLDRVEGELAKSKVAAPAAGIVILEQDGEGRGMQSRDLQPGDRVWEGRPVATIADLSEMQIEIQLDPDQARRVKRKQKVIITVDAITGKTFEGEVAEISQTATENTLPGTGMPSGERTFPAKIAVKNLKGTVLLPGMTAQVRIITKTIKDTVSVPKECVFDQNDVKVVYVKKGDAFSAVEVETGDQSDGMIIITRGLKGRETLSLRAVKEGNSSGSATTPEKKPPTTAPATGGVK